MEREKHVDESWKDSVAHEKELNKDTGESHIITPDAQGSASQEEQNPMELNFVNYISSLIFQAMIFLGELPNPITNEIDKNLGQAKFLIDTLILLREKTKGNLTKPEEDLLNSAIYELEMRYVDAISKESKGGPNAQ
jgi:hypothetical protein